MMRFVGLLVFLFSASLLWVFIEALLKQGFSETTSYAVITLLCVLLMIWVALAVFGLKLMFFGEK